MLLVPTSLNFPAPVVSDLGQVSRVITAMVRAWNQLVQAYSQRINGVLPKDGTEAMTNPLPLEILTVATLPSAALWTGAIVYASDTGGVYFSNGSAWTKLSVFAGTGLTAIPNNDILSNISGGSALPVGNTLSATIDSAISNVQGSILYRDASAWLALGSGTAGNLLQTNGAAANPSWVSPPASVSSGMMMDWAGAEASVPSGWLICGGQAISRTTFAALFAVIGTTWGAGDGSTTFNVPDMRGRVGVGKDDMNGTAANRVTAAGSGITGTTLGATGGLETHTLTVAEIPSHTHTVPIIGSSGTVTSRAGGGATGTTTTLTSSSTGSGNAHPIMPPTAIVNKIIKT